MSRKTASYKQPKELRKRWCKNKTRKVGIAAANFIHLRLGEKSSERNVAHAWESRGDGVGFGGGGGGDKYD
ncbi:hypothetical protein E2C01_042824 [Portunus trituberculatus]|uniref:Uncharacterized protein n=1 Tax=Portunus trituberculatus TaxID=210409 RepID=A0A5B7FU11_PORTR|nr:hypothetical protein [Portunus trituberculatus]